MKAPCTFSPLLLITLFFLSPSASAQSQTQQEIRNQITQKSEAYFQAFVNGDPSLHIKNHAEGCWILPSEGPAHCGPDAATDFFKKTYHQGVRKGKLIINEIYGETEDFITEEGFYQFLNSMNHVLENGIYLTIWKKTENGWKIYRHSFHNHNPK
jgi:ketosteroid isomerase-like protein